MNDETLMPFGKYKGSAMANVPPDYLLWLLENNKCGYGEVRKYIQDNLEVIKEQIKYESKKGK